MLVGRESWDYLQHHQIRHRLDCAFGYLEGWRSELDEELGYHQRLSCLPRILHYLQRLATTGPTTNPNEVVRFQDLNPSGSSALQNLPGVLPELHHELLLGRGTLHLEGQILAVARFHSQLGWPTGYLEAGSFASAAQCVVDPQLAARPRLAQ